MKTNVYVLYGGRSVEHEVSIKSAEFIINSMDKDKYNVYPVYIDNEGLWYCLDKVNNEVTIDALTKKNDTYKTNFDFLDKNSKNIVFPALHGSFGEDGKVQGLLEMFNIPYVGNGVQSSAICIDKATTRDLLKGEVLQPNYCIINSYDWNINKELTQITNKINFPCYVKPASLGSSVGISRCKRKFELVKAVDKAFIYDDKIIIEEEIKGREIQVLVLGNEEPTASDVGEIKQNKRFLDYKIKYTDGLLSHVIPATIGEDSTKEVKELAIKIYKKLNCSGLSRVDFFITENNKIYLNEINTMPGFTKVSMVPDLWRATTNKKCDELIDLLIKLGFEKNKKNNKNLYKRS